jgi:Eukaryotic protein of unknown function (DUF829)
MSNVLGSKCKEFLISEVKGAAAATTTATNKTQNRPLVILAGWLGCHPKSLKRYEQLYRDCGFQTVISKIATPAMVVNAILHPNYNYNDEVEIPTPLPPLPLPPPHDWPMNNVPIIHNGSMTSMAWDVLREIHQTNYSFLVFHSFSNGGFFLWENIRQILFTYGRNNLPAQYQDDRIRKVSEYVGGINDTIGGLVFDSCPSIDMSKLPLAMQYVSWWQRLETIRYSGLDHLLLPYRPEVAKFAMENATFSVTALRDSSQFIPHLFLYSENDPLADSTTIDKIIAHRTKHFGVDKTFSKRWESSIHCGHLRCHPEEYYSTIEKFTQVCALQSMKYSRL